jgi:hypothetical protein
MKKNYFYAPSLRLFFNFSWRSQFLSSHTKCHADTTIENADESYGVKRWLKSDKTLKLHVFLMAASITCGDLLMSQGFITDRCDNSGPTPTRFYRLANHFKYDSILDRSRNEFLLGDFTGICLNCSVTASLRGGK